MTTLEPSALTYHSQTAIPDVGQVGVTPMPASLQGALLRRRAAARDMEVK